MTVQKREVKRIYANKPQIMAGVVYAPTLCTIGGRGIGKTHGFIAPRAYRNALNMPRSLGAFVGKSYDSIVNSIIPACIKSWEGMGLVEGVHFIVGEDPTSKKYRWEKPIRAPKDYKNVVSWVNGSAQMFNSLDKNAFNNGREFDYADYDEYRFLPYDGIAEFNKAIRGNSDLFGHLSCHGSRTYTGDMARYPDERWIFDIAKQHDQKSVESIAELEDNLQILYMQYAHATDKANARFLQLRIKSIEQLLNRQRFNVTQTVYASTIDNIDVLGASTILNMVRTERPMEVLRGILNVDTHRGESGFYSSFNDKKHTYTAANVGYIENQPLNYRNDERDCRWDDDHNPNIPLSIGVDWGVRCNCMEVGQRFDNTYKIINSFDVVRPKKLKHLVEKFTNYYRFHKYKVVRHFRDHTSNNESPISEVTYAEELRKLLKAKGWELIDEYKGQAKSHSVRHKFFDLYMSGHLDYLPALKINSTNCSNLITSLEDAGTREDKDGKVIKDKRPEQNDNLDQTKTTHHSEALDVLLMGEFFDYTKNHSRSFVSARTA